MSVYYGKKDNVVNGIEYRAVNGDFDLGHVVSVMVDTRLADVTKSELGEYVKLAKEKIQSNMKLTSVTITKTVGNNVAVDYTGNAREPFERIRRITGYLVGDLNRWNNAKKAEERDRVKHAGRESEGFSR